MAEPKPLRVGIIGAGGIARGYHVPSYQRCENVRVVAACDVSEAALEAMREQHGVERLCRDYDRLLEMDDLDLVSICTSNDMHYAVAMAAMEKGFDVYCEKPLALTYAECCAMYETAQARGLRTGVNFSHRRTPASRLAKEIIDSGALGDIYHVSAIYAGGGTGYASRPGSWRNVREKAGYGGLGDMGSHVIDMVLWWLGCDVVSITGHTRTFVPERMARDTGLPMKVTTEDHGSMLLNYSNGAAGYLCGSYTFTGRGYDQRIEVYGSEGGLLYDQQRGHELQVHLAPEYLERYVVSRQGGTRDTPYSTILVPERHLGIIDGAPGARRTVLMDFVDDYRADGPFSFSPGFYEGVRVQEVLEAGRCAEETRSWVDLPLRTI
jgi:predicted dehydrogenase